MCIHKNINDKMGSKPEFISRLHSIAETFIQEDQISVVAFLSWAQSLDAINLMESNPCVGLMLANIEIFIETADPWNRALSLVELEPKEILVKLGFSDPEAALILFQKVEIDITTAQSFLLLRNLLEDGGEPLKMANDLFFLCGDSIFILATKELRDAVEYSFMEEVGARNTCPTALIVLQDALDVAEVLDVSLPKVTSVMDCTAFISPAGNYIPEMAITHGLKNAHELVARKFPESPINIPEHTQPSGLSLVYIDSSHLLILEEMELRNRAFTYWEAILDGDISVFRVNAPERATVVLEKTMEEHWKIKWCRTKNEDKASRETIHMVGAYLNSRIVTQK